MKAVWCAVLVVVVCLFSSVAFGQFDTADVLGTVRDVTGAAVTQASVTLVNENTNVSLKTTTDGSGNYNFQNVKPGTYTVTAEQSGFRTLSSSRVSVNVGARQRVDMTMEVGVIT